MKYKIHDVVPSKDPRKLMITVIKYSDTTEEEFTFDVDGTTTKEQVLLEIDNIMKATILDYMDFKVERNKPKDI